MTYAELANPGILTQPVYEPGRPIEVVARELGLDPEGIVKLASNENPLGPSPRAVAAGTRALRAAHLYPDGGSVFLRERLARQWQLAPDQFVVGNGSNELIELLGHVFLAPGVECVVPQASFIVYQLVARLFGATAVTVPLGPGFHQDLRAVAAAVTARTRLVCLASPANPVGTANTEAEIGALARALPEHVVLVLDEAYAEFLDAAPDLRPLLAEGRRVVGLRTFSKIYGLAALRVGYAYGDRELIALLQRARQPFNVNGVAAAAALAALDDEEFVARVRRENREGLGQLEAGLARLGVEFVPGRGNFLLARVGDGAAVAAALLRGGLITRPVAPYGLPEWLRITVGTAAQNTRLLGALGPVLGRA